jgi:hypothetical protein
MKKIGFVCFLLFLHFNLFAQVKADETVIVIHENLKENLSLGLEYMEKTQRKEAIPGHSYRGEWQTFISLRMSFVYLGSKKEVDDSNCFSVASIHNSLAGIYLIFPEYEAIPDMLDLSFEKIMTYRNGDKYNFWNLLPPNIKLKRDDIIGEQPLVRRPTNYRLTTKYINKAAHVVEDADDTGLAYTAIALRKKYKKEFKDSLYLSSKSIAPIFEQYRDINRNNRHWYNYLNGNDHETGAYLTWLAKEYQFKRWNILKVLGHNATFFLPFSECYPHAYVPYIPYGSNDLDGVVNANVLTTLSHYDELNADGVNSAISFIEKKSKRKKYDRVGIYYPNRYHFPYAVSKAYANGVEKLELSTDYLLSYLIDTQNEDGSWSARRIVNKKDKLQSTAYALNALINIGDFEENKTIEPIENAIKYISNHSIKDEDGIHWEGGVFFSGGTVVRNILWWKSDAYTTAIILGAFANYRKHLEEKYDIALLKK